MLETHCNSLPEDSHRKIDEFEGGRPILKAVGAAYIAKFAPHAERVQIENEIVPAVVSMVVGDCCSYNFFPTRFVLSDGFQRKFKLMRQNLGDLMKAEKSKFQSDAKRQGVSFLQMIKEDGSSKPNFDRVGGTSGTCFLQINMFAHLPAGSQLELNITKLKIQVIVGDPNSFFTYYCFFKVR